MGGSNRDQSPDADTDAVHCLHQHFAASAIICGSFYRQPSGAEFCLDKGAALPGRCAIDL
jgi:hypothetical protein